VLQRLGLTATVVAADIASVARVAADAQVILTSAEFVGAIGPTRADVVVIENYFDTDELAAKLEAAAGATTSLRESSEAIEAARVQAAQAVAASEAARQHADSERAATLERLEAEREGWTKRAEEAHKAHDDLVTALREDTAKTLASSFAAHGEVVERARVAHAEEVQRMTAAHEAELARVRGESDAAIRAAKEAADAAVKAAQEAADAAVKAAENNPAAAPWTVNP
jgi:PTS system ascorbate-specific IIB component